MCVPKHCTNKIFEPALGETAKDCGGDCGSVCTSSCGSLPASGSTGHCTASCPCAFKDGDCDTASQCPPLSACLQDRGDLFGFSASTDVCVASHCGNASLDGGETAVDCGGPDCAACSGDAVKATRFGGTSSDYAQGIGIDGSGNYYLALRYVSSPFDIGLGNVGNAGKYDILVAKFSPLGVPLWNQKFGNAGADGDHNVALAVDSSGNSYLVSNYYDTIHLGGTDYTVVGSTDVQITKLDPNGGHVWSRSLGGPNVDRVRRIVVDPNGDLLIVGYFLDSIDLGGQVLTSAGNNDAFVAKLRASDSAVNSAGELALAGYFSTSIDFGSGSVAAQGTRDIFLLRDSAAGSIVWSRTFGGGGLTEPMALLLSSNTLSLTGYFEQTVAFNPLAVGPAGGRDAFWTRFTF